MAREVAAEVLAVAEVEAEATPEVEEGIARVVVAVARWAMAVLRVVLAIPWEASKTRTLLSRATAAEEDIPSRDSRATAALKVCRHHSLLFRPRYRHANRPLGYAPQYGYGDPSQQQMPNQPPPPNGQQGHPQGPPPQGGGY